MDSHSRPTDTDPRSVAEQDELWRLFDEIGEAKVRAALHLKNYDERTAILAREWLVGRASQWADEERRSLKALLRETNNVAHGSNELMQTTSNQAQKAHAIALENQEITAKGLKIAEQTALDVRTSLTIATWALIGAVFSLMVAIAAFAISLRH